MNDAVPHAPAAPPRGGPAGVSIAPASGCDCWLGYPPIRGAAARDRWAEPAGRVALSGASAILASALAELRLGLSRLLAVSPVTVAEHTTLPHVLIAGPGSPAAQAALGEVAAAPGEEVCVLAGAGAPAPARLVITGNCDRACLLGVFWFLRLLQTGAEIRGPAMVARAASQLRMIDHWDNLDGSVERGYSGRSIFFEQGAVAADLGRVRDYARLLASTGINAIAVNNVNVGHAGAQLLTQRLLTQAARLAAVFRAYGIRMFLSVDFGSPILIGGLRSADPGDAAVAQWWAATAADVYQWIPDLGGFLVKADSETRAGPGGYGRTQADGANMLAAAVRPFGGIVVWRAFVYDCEQDWRDRTADRAKAAFDTFAPLDGAFGGNVVVQVKNGPMDFQAREPAAPLLEALTRTSVLLELQITQEYTGQQKDLCFLPSQWAEVLSAAPGPYAGMAGVSNVGRDATWTGNILAQANLYGFGRLAWDPTLAPGEIAREWAAQTFGPSAVVVDTVTEMLLASWLIYESYTAPLGAGWMVTPGSHYGPDVDGYEYSRWGTYHRADRDGVGVDRTVATGTGFTAQYGGARARLYEDPGTCPDELLLFFHHVPYSHRLHSGKTVIQHIYDSHFEGAERANWLLARWRSLAGHIDAVRLRQVEDRLKLQVTSAARWRDVVNTYFYRKSGVPDEHGRPMY